MTARRSIGAFAVRIAAVLLLLTAVAGPAWSGQRVALVIGNAAYAHAPRLANPLNDVADIGAALERLGFAVTRLENADYAALRRGLLEFTRAASASEVAVVFYAGHGIEVDKRNFLVPVDARLLSDRDIEYEAVPLELVSRAVERASGLRLVILDACRENPFAASMQRAGATRSIGRGLARIEPSGETLVAYAAKEGTVASDGEERNSPYSAALLKHLEEPGLEVGLMFRKVRDAVVAATGGSQEPFIYGSLSSKGVYLASAPAPAAISATASRPNGSGNGSARLTAERLAAERLFWESVKDDANAANVRAYLDRFPTGTYAVLARNRLKQLEGGSEPVVQPPAVAAPSPAAVPEPGAVEASLDLGLADRHSIQMGLASLGFDPGPADGLFGGKTRAALAAWQAAKGEALTGWLTGAEADVLKAAGVEARRAEDERKWKARAAAEALRKAEAGKKARQQTAMKPGRVFRDCADCPEMVVVPASSFTMGAPASEEDRNKWEGPQHRVRISQPFAVGKYEVKRGEFERFVAATGHSMGNSCSTFDDGDRSDRDWRNPGYRQDSGHPAVCVSWDDARAYVSWLSRKTGHRYRLLNEAEWEYATRAGSGAARYWGNDEAGQCRHANGADSALLRNRSGASGRRPATCNDGYVHTSPAGSFPSNAFGLHDMLGNVWEWVEDCEHRSYSGAPSDGSAWTAGGNCSRRVWRGGSWWEGPWGLRSATRTWGLTGIRLDRLGFRVSRTLTP